MIKHLKNVILLLFLVQLNSMTSTSGIAPDHPQHVSIRNLRENGNIRETTSRADVLTARHRWRAAIKSRRVNNTISPSDLSLYLYTRHQPEGQHIPVDGFTGAIPAPAGFNPSTTSYFIAHGSGSNHNSMASIKNAILAGDPEANVFLLDYSILARKFYTIAVKAVPQLGTFTGGFIEKLVEFNNVTLGQVNLIGHSLGAQVVGAIGQHLKGDCNYIVGLDPAGPLFETWTEDLRLDKSDAQFVEVVHTNGGFEGVLAPIGHADFFPNGGGMGQKGCGPDLFGACAHQRAVDYYVESLSRKGGFMGRACPSYDDYKQGLCDDNDVSYFGELAVDKRATGNYYFDTNPRPPFATGEC